jgi:hypothetical protein
MAGRDSLGSRQKREDAMAITATLPAPPDLSAQRRPILAVGSGFAGLAATKALKLAQLNITDALVFVTGVIAHTASHLVNQAARWTPMFPAAVTASVLAGLAIASAIDIVKIIASQPNSRCAIESDGVDGLVLRHILWWHSRPMAKGSV